MQTQVLGQAAALTTACSLPSLRAQLTALTFHSPHLDEAEKLRANHCIHECEDAERLTNWLRTVQAELARRNMAAQTQKALTKYAAPKRQALPHPTLRNRHHPRPPRRAPKPPVGTLALHYVIDRPAPPLDRRAAAQFQPARTLTYGQLLRR